MDPSPLNYQPVSQILRDIIEHIGKLIFKSRGLKSTEQKLTPEGKLTWMCQAHTHLFNESYVLHPPNYFSDVNLPKMLCIVELSDKEHVLNI